MGGPIRLFISSSPGLAPEREAMAQAVAELPISVGWEIKHTARPHEDIADVGRASDEQLAFVGRCDLYVVVLGADFAAPMGLEWQRALGAGTPVLAYRKRVLHSPAAQALLRRSDVSWTPFDSPRELKKRATRALARALMDRGEHLGLLVDDIEGLLSLMQAADEEEQEPAEPDRRRGAGRDGVILGRGA
jgi:hypothetical protein